MLAIRRAGADISCNSDKGQIKSSNAGENTSDWMRKVLNSDANLTESNRFLFSQ
jgi:hypothetical protein